jgi:hypothetical protein
MPIALYSFKIDSDGRVRTGHIFFAANLTDAEKQLAQHADLCPKFGPAVAAGETVDIGVEIGEIPDADENSLEEFLDLDEDEDEEEDDDDEDDEEEEEP